MPAPGDRFNPTPRHLEVLREVIDALRLVGVLLTIGGIAFTSRIFEFRDPLNPRVAAVTGLVTIPGVLYVIASVGLTRRRYWAWTMSLIVTVLLIVALLAGMIVVTCLNNRGGQIFIPGIFYLLMPVLILIYMLRTLPVLRETELLDTKGFIVLPLARPATDNRSPSEEAESH
jgi:hypothetical protein